MADQFIGFHPLAIVREDDQRYAGICKGLTTFDKFIYIVVCGTEIKKDYRAGLSGYEMLDSGSGGHKMKTKFVTQGRRQKRIQSAVVRIQPDYFHGLSL